ncbi:MAG: sensor histidine kinase, partial [Mycobacterium sp.]
MSVTSAVTLVAVTVPVALAVGMGVGIWLARSLAERRRREATERAGITVSQMLTRIVALAPLGTAVVDTHRDVVFRNDRATELGLVRDRLLDDRAWAAAQQALAGDE